MAIANCVLLGQEGKARYFLATLALASYLPMPVSQPPTVTTITVLE